MSTASRPSVHIGDSTRTEIASRSGWQHVATRTGTPPRRHSLAMIPFHSTSSWRVTSTSRGSNAPPPALMTHGTQVQTVRVAAQAMERLLLPAGDVEYPMVLPPASYGSRRGAGW